MLNLLLLLLLCLSSFLSSLPQVQSATLPSDIYVLKALKASIKPNSISPWSCLGSWNFSIDPCSLPRRTSFICGVSCSPDSTRVTSLVLDPVRYSGTLTPLISQLTQLTQLDLSENSFYGPIPSSLSSLAKLETLSLRSNFFTGTIPSSLTKLASLVSLDFSNNALTGLLPVTLSSLSGLTTMDLSFNKLTGSLPKLPPNLVNLALKANSLSGSLSPSSFQGLTQLEVVELGANRFTGAVQAWFFLIPSLQQFDLSNNSFTSIEIQKLGNTKNSNLVAVDLGFNRIEGYLPVNLATFPQMASLTLRYNRFRGPIPWEYYKKVSNQSLRRLFLDGNFLNGKPPAGFFSTGSGSSVAGSFGYNCLESCPASSQLCLPSQKPTSVCRKVYGGRTSP
ncbi:leucine-rich repeat receptor-like serine/threonine-protein kinase BAM2 [Macadamia integrifolia]|uniref:leucine-rich repeat receptor-like serine/threonine-protein kinase BAM2 n=1 Tax=Macadamia integrifolia TaxID=60698 RepID=UPI001C4E7EAD|nr:leucine-rich repeat receptor-like serine/threonine-protein kinase BAM2 [Macadamia integrifolia]